MRKLCEVLDCCMSTIVEFGTFSIESKMFLLWFQISALVSLVLSAELQPNPGSCPLIDTQVATINDVKVCIQSLTKRSPTEYCGSNQADCELVFADCGQNKVTHGLLCVWRNCFDSCILMSDDQDTCVESCLGLKDECESSKSVQEMIDCHVKLVGTRARVDESKIICPLVTKSQSDLSSCVDEYRKEVLERTCHRLGSACKYADIGDCKSSIRNHWFDTRLLCAAIRCDHICSVLSAEGLKLDCKKACIGQEACRNKKVEESLLCHIEASEKFIVEHKLFKPFPLRPIRYDRRKLVDCSVLFSVFKKSDPEMDGHLTDCIHMMITMNMDKYCQEYKEDCQLFSDDCKQAKPMKLLYTLEKPSATSKYQVDTYLACLGHKCSKACSEKWTGNQTRVFKCRTDCIGDIGRCSNQAVTLDRINCHIDQAVKFIEESQNEESPGENEETTPGGGFKAHPTKKRALNGGNRQKSQVEVTIAILTVLLFNALGLIFNDTLL